VDEDELSIVDLDNTIYDTDRLIRDLKVEIEMRVGHISSQKFWSCYEQVRLETGAVDLTRTLELCAALVRCQDHVRLVDLIWNFPNPESYVIDGAIATLRYLRGRGKVMIMTDGERLFQESKILGSGLVHEVDQYLVYPGKTKHFLSVAAENPSSVVNILDDKPSVAADARQLFGAKARIIMVAYGKYGAGLLQDGCEDADVIIGSISDLPAAHQRLVAQH